MSKLRRAIFVQLSQNTYNVYFSTGGESWGYFEADTISYRQQGWT